MISANKIASGGEFVCAQLNSHYFAHLNHGEILNFCVSVTGLLCKDEK